MTDVDVQITPRTGSVDAEPLLTVTLSAVLPTAGHAVPDYTAGWAAAGRYEVTDLPLMMPGRWEFFVDVSGHGHHDHLLFPLVVNSSTSSSS
jgi:hypothetical protein